MHHKIKILVVDDSETIRKQLKHLFKANADMEIIGEACEGIEALQKMASLCPNIIILDIEMPGMDGLETLKNIRQIEPRLPVIMFSTLTQKGAVTTLDALSLGANDYVTKPSQVGEEIITIQEVKEQLIHKIKALTSRRKMHLVPPLSHSEKSKIVPPNFEARKNSPKKIILIGASTG